MNTNTQPRILPFKSKDLPDYTCAVYYTELTTEERKRCIFKTRQEGENFIKNLRQRIAHNFSTQEEPLSNMEFAEYTRLSGILAPFSKKLESVTSMLAKYSETLKSLYSI